MNVAKEYREQTGFKWPDSPPEENCQIDMFGGGKSTDEVQLECAIELVELAGYRVVKDQEGAKELAIEQGYIVVDYPIIGDERVITLTDLRNYFYARLWMKYPGRRSQHRENPAYELRMMRLFVESLEGRGFNKRKAVQYGVDIIDTIFTYETEFNFKMPIDMRVMGQGKSGWITSKAIEILDKKYNKNRELETQKHAEALEEHLAQELETQTCVDENLDRILSDMEAKDGQKEGSS